MKIPAAALEVALEIRQVRSACAGAKRLRAQLRGLLLVVVVVVVAIG